MWWRSGDSWGVVWVLVEGEGAEAATCRSAIVFMGTMLAGGKLRGATPCVVHM